MTRFLIKLSYDGTNFKGWQIQPKVRTVQDDLEKCLAKIAKTNVQVTGSGRTDAGVHARAQYANFDLDLNIEPDQLIKALNSNLPDDVFVRKCWQVSDDFSARYDAVSRTYIYRLAKEYSPFNRLFSVWLPRFNIDKKGLLECLPWFCGKHDFSSFAQQNPDLNHYLCNLTEFSLHEQDNEYVFTISANRFLHNMVRRIIGTCLRVVHTKSDPEIIRNLIAARDSRNNLIYCAPPQGLFLVRVVYPTIEES